MHPDTKSIPSTDKRDALVSVLPTYLQEVANPLLNPLGSSVYDYLLMSLFAARIVER